MSRLFSSKEIEKVLKKNGFVFVSQKGSHIKFRKSKEKVLTVIVPANKREIPLGTFKSIVRQSSLDVEDFKL